MRTFTSSLPVGPYDWHHDLIPRRDAEGRLAAVRAAMDRAGAEAIVVHGNTLDDAALVWLTGFTPKLGPAFAFVPAEGAVRILFSGGPGMRPSAAKLTWLEDVRALRGIEADFTAWLADARPARNRAIGLWDGGNLSEANLRAIERAASPRGAVTPLGGVLDPLRRRKTERERGLIARAAKIAAEVRAAIGPSFSGGHSRHHAALAAERRGYDLGAQDVRVLISRRAGGLPEPAEPGNNGRTQSANVYVAVRCAGYWADFHGEAGAASELARHARAALKDLVPALGAGWSAAAYRPQASGDLHASINGIGTGVVELPLAETGATLQAGDVCSLRIEARQGGQVAIASCLIAIERNGATILSPALEA